MTHVIGRILRGVAAGGTLLLILGVFTACSLDTGSSITQPDSTDDSGQPPTNAVGSDVSDWLQEGN